MSTGGFGGRSGFGRRPALVVVDMSVGFTDPESPLHCDLDGPLLAIAKLLETARAAGIPVFYTTVAYRPQDRATAAAFLAKVPALLTLEPGSRWVEIDPRIAPRKDEPVLTKLFASAFFGTDLSARLARRECDTVIVTGASTSGCVRATAVDALQHGYSTVVPRSAVGDRDPGAHEANLHDIELKYGDVVELEQVLGYLSGLGN